MPAGSNRRNRRQIGEVPAHCGEVPAQHHHGDRKALSSGVSARLASLAANLRLEKKLLEMDMISEMRSWLVEPEDSDDEDEDDNDADDNDGATAQAATPM